MLSKYVPYRIITLFFLFLLAAGLPMGKIFMSIASIGLAATWVVEGKYREKWKINRELNHAPLVLSGIFLLHVIWLVNTENYGYAWHDLLLKLPLLSFPIVIGTTKISKTVFKWIIYVFIASVLVSSLISYGVYLEWIPPKKSTGDIRDISLFMSHIRLSLLVCMSIVFSVYFSFRTRHGWMFYILVVWKTYFLLLLSGTGIVILVALLIYAVLVLVKVNQSKRTKWSLAITGFLFVIFSVYHVYNQYIEFSTIKDTVDLNQLEAFSKDGEKYIHDVHDRRTDNGYYTWIYIAPEEAEVAWNSVSNMPFNALDKKGQPLKYTLYRYLTSKGERKDRLGVLSLTKEDIANIENGESSVVSMNPIDKRIQEIFFEFREMHYGSGGNGHSVVQRLMFVYTGYLIYKDHWIAGVGTGDVPAAFKTKYEEINSPLDIEHRLRSHNQFLTFLISFGTVGFLLFLVCWLYPVVKFSRGNILYGAFLIIVILSFFSDNTLERQAGVTFFAFFNSFLLFNYIENKERN